MEAERWRRIQDLFDQALELQGDARASFLDQACGRDDALRREIQAMLEVDDELSVEYLETVVMGGSALLSENFDPILGRGTIGKYKIEEKVGEGGFGMVHRGVDLDLKRDVAIKTCTSSDERLRARFQREAEISASLQHPNITTVHDLGTTEDGLPYLVQEFLIGEDLSDKIERQEPLDTSTRLDYLLQIARGLNHAHRNGVLHRDVKPGNMRVLHNGRLKILDFGIARLVDDSNPMTTEGVAVGTVGYLAPEQFEGSGVDRRSDIFSFGVVAYELLTQVRPFPGKTFSEVSYKLMTETPQPMGELWPDCPVDLEYLVNRCLEKEKQHRYQSLDELIPDLEAVIELLEGDIDGTTTVVTAGLEARRRQRNRWLIMAISLLGLVLLLTFGKLLNDSPPAIPNSTASTAADVVPAIVQQPVGEVAGTSTEPPEPPVGLTDKAAGTSSELPRSGLDEVAGTSTGTQKPSLDEVAGTSTGPSEPSVNEVPGTSKNSGKPPVDEVAGTSTETQEPSLDEVAGTSTETQEPSLDEVVGTSTETQEPSLDEVAGTSTETQEPSLDEVAGTSPPPPDPVVRDPVVRQPELLHRAEPKYPEKNGRRINQEATVTVLVWVDKEGDPTRTTPVSNTNKGWGFEQASLDAAMESTFSPGTHDGVPTEMWTSITYEFIYK